MLIKEVLGPNRGSCTLRVRAVVSVKVGSLPLGDLGPAQDSQLHPREQQLEGGRAHLKQVYKGKDSMKC